jgi:hypothetical protein
VTVADAVTEPYGVAVMEVTDPTLADVTLNMDTISAVGGYTDGVLGCTNAGQITIISGWNFFAGTTASQIGSAQYDFQTVVTHELGHALGLGHSADTTSVMYATLNTGTVNRGLTTADLNVPDCDGGGACGLHAALRPSPGTIGCAPAIAVPAPDIALQIATANGAVGGNGFGLYLAFSSAVDVRFNQLPAVRSGLSASTSIRIDPSVAARGLHADVTVHDADQIRAEGTGDDPLVGGAGRDLRLREFNADRLAMSTNPALPIVDGSLASAGDATAQSVQFLDDAYCLLQGYDDGEGGNPDLAWSIAVLASAGVVGLRLNPASSNRAAVAPRRQRAINR